jgi:hypothetical protein
MPEIRSASGSGVTPAADPGTRATLAAAAPLINLLYQLDVSFATCYGMLVDSQRFELSFRRAVQRLKWI